LFDGEYLKRVRNGGTCRQKRSGGDTQGSGAQRRVQRKGSREVRKSEEVTQKTTKKRDQVEKL